MFAVVGQPEVALSCVVLAKRGALTWQSSTLELVQDLHVIGGEEHIRATLDKFSMANRGQAKSGQQQQQPSDTLQPLAGQTAPQETTTGPAAAAAEDDNDDTLASNYTIYLRNVSLADDDHYQCYVGEVDRSHRYIESRRAKLTVLQPPGKLELTLARVSSANGTETDYSGMSPQDTPLGFDDKVSQRCPARPLFRVACPRELNQIRPDQVGLSALLCFLQCPQ